MREEDWVIMRTEGWHFCGSCGTKSIKKLVLTIRSFSFLRLIGSEPSVSLVTLINLVTLTK
jgi:hypothetical protein